MGLLHLTLGSACAIGAVCITFLAVRFCSFRPLKRERRAAPTTQSLLLHHEHRDLDNNEKDHNVTQIRSGEFKNYGADLGVRVKVENRKDKTSIGNERLNVCEERSKEERLQDKIAEITIQR